LRENGGRGDFLPALTLELVSLIPIGYPAEYPEQTKRPLCDGLHWERF